MAKRPLRPAEAGFTLLEVVVALALLGLVCISAFGVLTAGLRVSRAATNYTTAVLEGERILNEVVANGMTTDTKEGILESGYRWKAERIRASSVNAEAPAQILRVQVSVWWPSFRGEQHLDLTTFTLAENQPLSTDADQHGNLSPVPRSQGGRL